MPREVEVEPTFRSGTTYQMNSVIVVSAGVIGLVMATVSAQLLTQLITWKPICLEPEI